MGNVNAVDPTANLMTTQDYEEARKADEAFYQATFGMSQAQYEIEVTASIAESCHFSRQEGSDFYICELCGTRFSVKYIGADINDRMLDHYENHVPEVKRLIKAELDRLHSRLAA